MALTEGVAPVVSGIEATAAKTAVEGAGTGGDTAATATRYTATVSAQSSEDGSLVGVVVKKGTVKVFDVSMWKYSFLCAELVVGD